MPKYQMEKNRKLRSRKVDLENLFSTIFESKCDWPYYVADQATIFDISLDSEEELVSKLNIKFKIRLTNEDLKISVWELIDKINKSNKADSLSNNESSAINKNSKV